MADMESCSPLSFEGLHINTRVESSGPHKIVACQGLNSKHATTFLHTPGWVSSVKQSDFTASASHSSSQTCMHAPQKHDIMSEALLQQQCRSELGCSPAPRVKILWMISLTQMDPKAKHLGRRMETSGLEKLGFSVEVQSVSESHSGGWGGTNLTTVGQLKEK